MKSRNSKAKSGFRVDVNIGMRGDSEITETRKARTPGQRIRDELFKGLSLFDKKVDVSDALKREFLTEIAAIDTAMFMNMKTLAATFLYLHKYPQPTPNDFTEAKLMPYLDVLMVDFGGGDRHRDKPSREEYNEVRYRYKQTLLRYVIKVLASRNESNQDTNVFNQEEGEEVVTNTNKPSQIISPEEEEEDE